MRPVVLDFETFYSDEYTLSKMTTESYIRDPRFEAHGAAIKWDKNTSAQWYDQRELAYILKEEDWSDVFLIHHHAQFDGFILKHHYNVDPAMFGCTLSMARMLLGNHLSVSLDSVRKHFGLPTKTTPYNLFKGKRWADIDDNTRRLIGEGACDEVESIWKIFGLLMRTGFPPAELDVVDSVIRMFTDPVLELDTAVLAQLWESEAAKKLNGVESLGVTKEQLSSSDQFAELLRTEGIEPETKISPRGNEIYAFAKNDPFMRDFLAEHDNPRVRQLAEARLDQKSTLLQTRAATLGWVASRGPAPVYLFYSGASTLRPSGGDGCNWLNFKRGSPIRRAIKAPTGHYLAPVDSSQLECRIAHYLAGGPNEPVIQKFRNGEDPYVDIASNFYQEEVYKPKPDDPRYDEMTAKRGMGKQGRLMCLASCTVVLTDKGWKAITQVGNNDLLWDGVEWVMHQGLISQGEQNVVEIAGVKMTSEHQILCGIQSWQPAAACLQDENMLFLALENGSDNLPLQATNWGLEAAFLTSWFNVLAERLNIPYILTIYNKAGARAATLVLKKLQAIGLKNTMVMPTSAPMNLIGDVCLDASVSFIIGANQNQTCRHMLITADEGFKFVLRGKTAGVRSWRIWSLFRDGISPNLKLIASKIKKAINLAIYDSLHTVQTPETVADFGISSKKLPTYDISSAGPRNRFTILSKRGPLIVHNCGFGASGKQFKSTAASGTYGPRVDMTLAEADAFVAMYRQTNPSICARNTGYWAQCERMLARLAGGDPIDYGPVHIENHRIYIQGRPMIYDSIEYHTPQPGEENPKQGWRVKKRDGWRFIWGSKLLQNLCEGIETVIVSEALVRIKKKYGIRTLNWPYDELLLLIPRDGREEEMLQLCIAEMSITPYWLPGLPLAADGALGERYEK